MPKEWKRKRIGRSEGDQPRIFSSWRTVHVTRELDDADRNAALLLLTGLEVGVDFGVGFAAGFGGLIGVLLSYVSPESISLSH
jgi:hypothetical protein